MQLTLLGTGGPRPDPQRHAAATVLQMGDQSLLFDTGRGVVLQSVRAGIALGTVNPIFLSHHHYDHIGDLADVILTSWLLGRERPLQIFGPPGTSTIVNALLQHIYDKDIAFQTHEQQRPWPPVESTDVRSGLVYDDGTWRVFAEVVVHGHGIDFPSAFTQRWICLGYRVEATGAALDDESSGGGRIGAVTWVTLPHPGWRKNCINNALTCSGCSCCTQCPAPSNT
jgi:ribonuclease Z